MGDIQEGIHQIIHHKGRTGRGSERLEMTQAEGPAEGIGGDIHPKLQGVGCQGGIDRPCDHQRLLLSWPE